MSNKTSIKDIKKAEKKTERDLKEIRETWDGNQFQIPHRDNRVEILDLEEAVEKWIIQPKDDDTPIDLNIIHRHNRSILNILRGLGLNVLDDPFWEGDEDSHEVSREKSK